MSSPNVSSLNGGETRPGDYRKVYSIIELVHLCGDGAEMCRDGAQETAGNSWLCNVDQRESPHFMQTLRR